MKFAVYINWTRKRACWHRETCGYVEMHGGVAERANQEWVICDTIAEVKKVLAAKTHGFDRRQVRPCGKCKPDSQTA